MLSLTLIFRNFHLAARGADRWRQVPQPTPSALRVRLTHRGNKPDRTVSTGVRRPRFRERGSCRLCFAATEKAARRDPISRRRRGSSAGPMVRIRLPPAASLQTFGSSAGERLPAFRRPSIIVLTRITDPFRSPARDIGLQISLGFMQVRSFRAAADNLGKSETEPNGRLRQPARPSMREQSQLGGTKGGLEPVKKAQYF